MRLPGKTSLTLNLATSLPTEAKNRGMTPSQTPSSVLLELREEGLNEFSDYAEPIRYCFRSFILTASLVRSTMPNDPIEP